jgi:hypothetical protein
MCGVYALLFHTGRGEKVYIGSTIQPFANRFKFHINELRLGRHPNIHLQRLWSKYGELELRILEECPGLSEHEIREREQQWIDLTPKARLINIGPALPSAAFGMRHSEATRAKIGAASRAHWQDPEYRAKVAAGQSISQSGRIFTAEHRAALSRAHRGVPLSVEHRASMSKAQNRPETREKKSMALSGRKLSPEHRAKSIAILRRWRHQKATESSNDAA